MVVDIKKTISLDMFSFPISYIKCATYQLISTLKKAKKTTELVSLLAVDIQLMCVALDMCIPFWEVEYAML